MKPKIAFFDFTSCEGCQLTVLDALQDHPELLDAVEIVQFREAMSEKGEDYQIAFVEGACTRPSDEDRLRAIRERADVVVALGACAHLGGINAIRNLQPLDDVRQYVYGSRAEWFETYAARPIEAVIEIDAAIPGCPIDRDEFITAVTHMLQGSKPRLPDYPMCIECKLHENICVYQNASNGTGGTICLGPVTRAGCKAICPANGTGCEGCRGMIPRPNLESFRAVLLERGLTNEQIDSRLSMFLTAQNWPQEWMMAEVENAAHNGKGEQS